MNKRILLAILFAPVLAYGGLKGYLWYGIKSSVDDVIKQASPFVEITYGGIFSTLEGEVGIENIVIQPVMTNDQFTVQSLSIRSESIFDFVNPEERFKDGKFPKHVGWEIKKLNLDLDSQIIHLMRDFQAQAEKGQPGSKASLFERADALGCGDLQSFGVQDFIAMGYSKMELDVAMDVMYLDISRQLQIDLRMQDPGAFSLDGSMRFLLDVEKIRAGNRPPDELEITALSADYTDTGYYKLRNAYCARKAGGETKYLDANIKQLSAELDGVLPKNILAEYRTFMEEGGTLSIDMKPAEAVKLSGMEFYETGDAMRLLGFTAKVNNVSFDANQLAWSTDGAKSAAIASKPGSASLSTQAPRVSPPVREQADVSEQPLQTKTVKVSRLSRYVGELVEIDIKGGKRRAGRLESVDEERVRILVRFSGGEFSFPVKLEEIRSAKVLQ